MTNEFLTLPEAAELLRLSEGRLRELIAAGAGPRVTRLTDRGRVLIAVENLQRWLDERTEPGQASE